MNENEAEKNIIDNIYDLLPELNTPLLKDLLLKKCEELNLSQRKLSKIIGIERKSLQRIMDGEAKKIDVVTFLKISQFLKINVEKLMQIYVSKLTQDSIKEIENTRKASFILHHFDLDILKKEDFIRDKNKYDEIANRIKSFFNLNTIFEYSQYANAAYLSRTQRSYSDKMLNFWISLVFHQIKKLNSPHNYDRELLNNIIPKLRGLTRDEENGLRRAALSLYEAGITVIFQSYIKKTSIRGATFIYNGKPYIILTDNNKRYDTIWFALLHEIYHILKDFEQIQTLNYHITGNSDLFIDELAEEQANYFARELLLPTDKLNYIKDFLDIPEYVKDYAEKNNVHPAIIYGFYLFDKEKSEEYKKYQKYILKSKNAIINLLINPWDKKDIDEITNQIKKIYKDKLLIEE